MALGRSIEDTEERHLGEALRTTRRDRSVEAEMGTV
jgi:hypothetical protein